MSGQRHDLINEAIAEAKRLGICEGLEMAASAIEHEGLSIVALMVLASRIRALKPSAPCATCGGTKRVPYTPLPIAGAIRLGQESDCPDCTGEEKTP